MKKTLISGVKPTGRPHLGNYFGAMKQFVDLQSDYETNIFIADLHAITTLQNGKELSENTLNVAIDYLAIGIDPKKTTIFKQSDLNFVCELAWIFDCITTVPYLMRAHAFKDAEAKNKEINVGVFNYPMLMAADILIQDADVVPVGKDQKQHIEIARDTAEKFNRIFGETFKIPEPIIMGEVETIVGIDGQKMSKSYKNTIPIFATEEEVEKSVMSIVTDSKGPSEEKSTETPLFKIHKLFLSNEGTLELQQKYKSGISYKDAKQELIKTINFFVEPLRESRDVWLRKKDDVRQILISGAKKTNEKVSQKIVEIRKKVGILM